MASGSKGKFKKKTQTEKTSLSEHILKTFASGQLAVIFCKISSVTHFLF